MNPKLALLAAAPQQTPNLSAGAGVGIGVIVIVVSGGFAVYLIKHKKVTGKHALAFFCLGLAMSGTQIGGMFQQMLGTVGQTLAQFVGQA